jgi:hypothetical protein
MYPQYKYDNATLAGLIRDTLLLRSRSFKADAAACLARMSPPPRILGAENIPQGGPCLITLNHYFRVGFQVWWLAFAITHALPMNPHWIMTGELTFPAQPLIAPIGKLFTRWLLHRFARVYGFTAMPPMPPSAKDIEERARSVREVLSYVERTPNSVLCLAPEGGDMPGGKLCYPPQGVGRFISLLAGRGLRRERSAERLRIVPVGGWEEDGELRVRFGAAYQLESPRHLPSDEKDRAAARVVMEHVAELLPEYLRGDFI